MSSLGGHGTGLRYDGPSVRSGPRPVARCAGERNRRTGYGTRPVALRRARPDLSDEPLPPESRAPRTRIRTRTGTRAPPLGPGGGRVAGAAVRPPPPTAPPAPLRLLT
ncbi:hypothetical protein GCM10011578_040520 [Streptomyces fuscichromogenes]|uniref:Uncharacterized protein n=1 Tax=Streptomyces fuscichromogenes TaxID=1324013 RepID=A0A917XEH6_9ACTN|nr:hypothetical protein GCM10011578_040520 [Streptomyces fuscichromogenes]